MPPLAELTAPASEVEFRACLSTTATS